MSVRQTAGELGHKGLSEDFNTRLLNRIAQERFKETRTAAYLPHRAPRFSFRVLVPVVVTAALALVAISSFQGGDHMISTGSPDASLPDPLDDRYLTAQPTSNPNLSAGLAGNWSLRQQLARAERLDVISRELTNRYGFSNLHLAGSRAGAQGFESTMLPEYLRQVPVFRAYRVTGGTDSREEGQAY
jgi:hypothetical protein